MYRTRIRKWGIDKNNKAAEVSYMLKLKKHRDDALGKGSHFLIRDRPVDWEDIERYLSRNPDFWTKHTRGSLDLATAGREIRCKTPPPAVAAQAISVPPQLDAPQDLHIHEEILRSYQAYTDGSFEQGIWRLSPTHNRYFGPGGVQASARLNAWYDKVRNVSDWPGRDAEAVQLVNCLLEDLPQLLKDQDYTVFPAVMRCCFYLSARRPALGRQVIHFVAQLCSILLGARHPMSLVWSRIRSLTISEYLLVLQGTAKLRLDHLESSRLRDGVPDDDDDDDDNTLNALREYLLILRLRGPAAVDEMNRVTCWVTEQICPPGRALSSAHCRVLLGTASSYIACGRFADAAEILDRVGAHLATSAAQDPYSRNLSVYLFIMGFLRYVTGRLEEAVNYFLQTYSALEKMAGPHSSAVADILLALVDFPGLLRDPKEVEHWKHKLALVQSAMLARAKKGVRHTASELSEMWDGPLDTDVNTGVW
ncbi:hypothetical protein BT67DRAFT_446072 [Trichocladium antarcticum]|uniref:Clr5 domain-containing protein n=1 Tax=Trichocladium antarcticum TaxID=1450529 RepID=A0AAN6UBP5_9PEZI|nr:hypothetical protein BT67DRAFT_446072 [Trichocladium antarcticum]